MNQSHSRCELGGSPTGLISGGIDTDRHAARAVGRLGNNSEQIGRQRLPRGVVVVALLALGLGGLRVFGQAGLATAGPVAALSFAAAVQDVRHRRIANWIVVACAAAASAGAVVAVVVERRGVAGVLDGFALAIILSGAPALLIIWLVRPGAIGGGDVKLLGVQAASLGLVAPASALVLVLVAMVGGLAAAVPTGDRQVPMGPGLALGYVAAVLAGVTLNDALGGWYP